VPQRQRHRRRVLLCSTIFRDCKRTQARASLPNPARTGLPPQHAKTARAGDPGLDWGPGLRSTIFKEFAEDAGEGTRSTSSGSALGPQGFYRSNTRPFKVGCLRFGIATLCRCSQLRDRVGRDGTNWDEHRSRGGWARNWIDRGHRRYRARSERKGLRRTTRMPRRLRQIKIDRKRTRNEAK
jgi:hypothetical protein